MVEKYCKHTWTLNHIAGSCFSQVPITILAIILSFILGAASCLGTITTGSTA